jgi:hypothetical protein
MLKGVKENAYQASVEYTNHYRIVIVIVIVIVKYV